MFAEEALLLSRLSNPNICNILGKVSLSEPQAMVLEYSAYGNLHSYLKDTELPHGTLVYLATQVRELFACFSFQKQLLLDIYIELHFGFGCINFFHSGIPRSSKGKTQFHFCTEANKKRKRSAEKSIFFVRILK